MLPDKEILPVSPETVTVLGYRVKATSPAWLGLQFARAEVREKSSLMVYVCGSEEAPYDLHLTVPFNHPDDPAPDEDDCWYRVRPRMRAGGRWKNRRVHSVRFIKDDGWRIEVGYRQSLPKS